MTVNTKQAAEMLSVSRAVVLRMTRNGQLKPVNSPKEGAKKFFPLYEQSHVREVKAQLKLTAKPQPARTEPRIQMFGPVNLMSQLDRIETNLGQMHTKLDLLLQAWGIDSR